MDLSSTIVMEQTIKLTQRAAKKVTRSEVTSFVKNFLKADDILAIWQMERQAQWFLTFEEIETVNV